MTSHAFDELAGSRRTLLRTSSWPPSWKYDVMSVRQSMQI